MIMRITAKVAMLMAGALNCPCAMYPGEDPPDLVGLDYFYEYSRWQGSNRIALHGVHYCVLLCVSFNKMNSAVICAKKH